MSLKPEPVIREKSMDDLANLGRELEKMSIFDPNDGTDMERLFEPKRAIFTFGRFQPPTRGHNNLINTVINIANRYNAEPFVFVSLTQNALKDTEWKKAIPKIYRKDGYISHKLNENPLSPDMKIEILNKMYPRRGRKINFINGSEQMPRVYSIQKAINFLKNAGYNGIYLVVGSARFQQFKSYDFEKKYGITLIENERILDEDFPSDEALYDIGTLTAAQIDQILNSDPVKVSGTATRQAAAEHKVNMPDINQLNDREVMLRIKGRMAKGRTGHTIKNDLGFGAFKDNMSKKLSDEDLEYYIYKIKKGMALNPFKEYRNRNKKLARRSSRTVKKGGKRCRRTRKKKGGAPKKIPLPSEAPWYAVTYGQKALWARKQQRENNRKEIRQIYIKKRKEVSDKAYKKAEKDIKQINRAPKNKREKLMDKLVEKTPGLKREGDELIYQLSKEELDAIDDKIYDEIGANYFIPPNGGKRTRKKRGGDYQLNWEYLPRVLDEDHKDEEYDMLPNNEKYKITKIGQNRIYFNHGERNIR